MLSRKVEHPNISNEGAGFDITQEPNPVILALVWVLALIVIGCSIILFAFDLTLRIIGAVTVASSVVPFLICRRILKQQGGFAAVKKKEPWPAFDWRDSLSGPTIGWSSLDRVQKTGIAFAIAVTIISLAFLIYVWLSYGL